ncbi:hypothetical protein C0989_008226 [Termitomyces sp. Mn162]|nr:hypothetical protein C0989_008226 [Termitomyces sp. Mn162]
MFRAVLCGLLATNAKAAVTIYGQTPIAHTFGLGVTATATATNGQPPPTQSLLPAYDETILQPPLPPDDQALTFTLSLPQSNASVPGISIMQHGSFYGFSIEMSVVTQLMGKNTSYLQVPFLNLLGLIQQRAGGTHIRIGGNTQDFAYRVDHIDNGHATDKNRTDSKNPTFTPAVLYTDELFYMVANISSHLNVGWYFGIPFNDTNWRLAIAERAQSILGDRLYGLQAGNEPDYYLGHGHRVEPYDVTEYTNEFASLVEAIQNNPNVPIKNMLIGPSLASGPWSPDRLWPTGYLDKFKDVLKIIAMEHYPTNNCFARFGLGSPVDPQKMFPNFLNHNAGINLIQQYLDTSARAQALGKPFIMFETNSATCGGLPGLSDSFGAALWAVDYGLTMAAANFSGALLHVGGQNVYYNVSCPREVDNILISSAPPTNQSSFHQWTVGAIYYSVLVVAEVFGKSNVSQIVDTSNNGIYNPSYAVYDAGALSKVVLINYIDDASGAHDITGTITMNDGQVPSQVYVKYLLASSVSVKTNITWAGQTLGNKYQVDGRFKGDLDIVKIQCDQGANQCRIPLRAPSLAVVFFTDPSAASGSEPAPTFATTVVTKSVNTATIDPLILATSNGHSGKDRLWLGSTSPGSSNTGHGSGAFLPRISLLFALVAGTSMFLTGLIL